MDRILELLEGPDRVVAGEIAVLVRTNAQTLPLEATPMQVRNIAPYKGLEYLVSAFVKIRKKDPNYRLIIVGSPKGPEGYWKRIRQSIDGIGAADRIVQKIEYVPDDVTEEIITAVESQT